MLPLYFPGIESAKYPVVLAFELGISSPRVFLYDKCYEVREIA